MHAWTAEERRGTCHGGVNVENEFQEVLTISR